MSFDLEGLLSVIADHGEVMRVVVTSVKGSAPRETGTAMLVWAEGQTGTIGGGALEFEAARQAREALAGHISQTAKTYPLGPAVGQCCGGSVSLLYHRFRADHLPTDFPLATPLKPAVTGMPNEVQALLGQKITQPTLLSDWFIEPLQTARRALWIYGAGHVGRALVAVLGDLPDLSLTWVDTAPDRFPATLPGNTRPLVARTPADVVRYAPKEAEHLVMTYSHKMDLDLCHALLGHGFRSAGLIGSDTKWTRFRKRLAELGHAPSTIDRITCPIGQPGLGKHPKEIAIGVAAQLLAMGADTAADHARAQQEKRA